MSPLPQKPSDIYLAAYLRTYNGHYVVPNKDGTSLESTVSAPDRDATFFIIPLDPRSDADHRVYVRTSSGLYLWAMSGGGGSVALVSPGCSNWACQWQVFQMEFDTSSARNWWPPTQGAKFGLRMNVWRGDHKTRYYICAEGGGGQELNATRTWRREWETFSIEMPLQPPVVVRLAAPVDTGEPRFTNITLPHQPGQAGKTIKVPILTPPRYLKAQGGLLTADGTATIPDQKFEILTRPCGISFCNNDEVSLRTCEGKFIHAAHGGGSTVDANGMGPSGDCRFRIGTVLSQQIGSGDHVLFKSPDTKHWLSVPFKQNEVRANEIEPWHPDELFGVEVSALPRVPIPQDLNTLCSETQSKLLSVVNEQHSAGQLGIDGLVFGQPNMLIDGRGGCLYAQGANVYWHPDLGTYAVMSPVLDKYESLGAAGGELGYPNSDTQQQDIDKSKFRVQRFQHGAIVCGDGDWRAVHEDGALLPRRTYRLSLDQLNCLEESSGAGSDDFWISFSVVAPQTLQGTKVVHPPRWRNGDVDTGEKFSPNITLYEGWLPEVLVLSYLGLEIDLSSKGKAALDKFDKKVEEVASTLVLSIDEDVPGESILDTLIGAGGVGGTIGALLGGPLGVLIAGESLAIENGCIVTITEAGAAAGGLGAAIGFGVGVTLGLVLDFLPPDLLLADSFIYDNIGLRKALQGNDNVSNGYKNVISTISKDLYVDLWWERQDSGDLLEHRVYRSTNQDSKYELVFRHHFY